MKRIALLSLALVAAGLLSGCGDPAPSTTLAPDKPMPDASKMSQEDVMASKAKDHDAGRQ